MSASHYFIFTFTGSETEWNAHKVEMALWAHFVVAELKKELLDGMPGATGVTPAPSSTTTQQPTENGDTQTQSPQKAKNVGIWPISCS